MIYTDLKHIKFVIFDLDGVFYKDFDPIHGGKEMIEFLNSHEIDYCFLTNNSCFELQTYQHKLKNCGIDVGQNKIITTTTLLLAYIKEQKFKDIYVLGSDYLATTLYKNFKHSQHNPDALILGMNDNMTLSDISNAINAIGENTKIIAANPDKLIPKRDGFALECGAIIDIVEDITKQEVFVVGKPNKYAYDYILKTFDIKKEETLMVGDTYETDIKGGLNYDIKAIWVKTGNALPNDISTDEFICLESLFEVIESF